MLYALCFFKIPSLRARHLWWAILFYNYAWISVALGQGQARRTKKMKEIEQDPYDNLVVLITKHPILPTDLRSKYHPSSFKDEVAEIPSLSVFLSVCGRSKTEPAHLTGTKLAPLLSNL